MKKIVFLPLDNRPVCVDRVVLQAKACGFNLVIPDIDLISTKLDGQPLNKNGTNYGDVYELSKWLENEIKDDVYAYILSMDQMLSGGLVNSRAIVTKDVSEEKKIIDKFFGKNGLLNGKKLYVFDTVMRLASTVYYNNYNHEDYVNIRNFGKLERYQFKNEELNFNNIINNYNRDENNNEILLPDGLSVEKRENYYNSRKRKLFLAEYFINKTFEMENIYVLYGIDDSSPKVTIQTNEIRYIREKLNSNNRGKILIGTDELASMLVERLCVDYYDYVPKVWVSFFGDQIDAPADPYDNGTLRENIYDHLEVMKADCSNKTDYDVEILVLTKASEKYSTEDNVKKLVSKAEKNIKDEMPTIIIDCSTFDYYGDLERNLVNQPFLGQILGYSNWNTVSNSVGLSLGQGLSRFIYLNQYQTLEEEFDSTKAFVKLLCISYYKDMGYKIGCGEMVKEYIAKYAIDNNGVRQPDAYLSFYNYIKPSNNDFLDGLDYLMRCPENLININLIKKNICNNKVLSKYRKDKELREYYLIKEISSEKFYYTWYRQFEITIDLDVEIKKLVK